MNKVVKVILWTFMSLPLLSSIALAVSWNYDYSMNESIESIRTHIDPIRENTTTGWGDSVRVFIFNLLDDIVIPLAISIWVVIWIIWAYKLLFSSDEKQVSTWLKMVVYWIAWIIIMVSAKYIWSVLFEEIFTNWNLTWQEMSWIKLSQELYNKIAYPFIKIALYLALAVIFVILVWKSITLITKTDWTSHKTALWMIWWCAVSILIIVGAKNIIEAIYWHQSEIFNDINNLGEIWSWILENKNIPIVYNIITRVLSLIGLLILILLLVQWFKILMNPGKAENFQKLWKNILFTLIWLLVIGVWYLIANSFILN